MTPQEARELTVLSLEKVAPDIDAAGLDGDAHFREDLGLDSLDFLGFVEALSDGSGRRIEEDDYAAVSTLDSCVAFLTART